MEAGYPPAPSRPMLLTKQKPSRTWGRTRARRCCGARVIKDQPPVNRRRLHRLRITSSQLQARRVHLRRLRIAIGPYCTVRQILPTRRKEHLQPRHLPHPPRLLSSRQLRQPHHLHRAPSLSRQPRLLRARIIRLCAAVGLLPQPRRNKLPQRRRQRRSRQRPSRRLPRLLHRQPLPRTQFS
jgi:hypothetical protein